MSEAPAQRRSYVFGPRARSGLTYGVSWSQAVLVALALLVSVLVLRAGHGHGRVVLAALTMLGSLLAATWPIAGRTAQQWLPVLARFGLATARSERRGVPLARNGPVRERLTVPFTALAVVEIAAGAGVLGAILDRENGTATAVIDVAGTSFALSDPLARQRLVDAWANVLSASGQQSGALVRLAWIERVAPDQSFSLRSDADAAFVLPDNDAVEAARASYLALLAAESRHAVRHDSLLAVSVRADRARTWELTLAEVGATLAARCRDIGLGDGLLMTPPGLRSYLRHQFAGGPVIDPVGSAFPIGVDEAWGSVRTDGTWHANYWVAEWPRSEVGCDFLLPLLQVRLRRTVALLMEPLPAGRAVRAAERTRTSNSADADLRRRHGFAITARANREHDAAARREIELAAGHAAFRFAGFVSVTARTEEVLRRDCERLEQIAASAHLDLRRLYGSQRVALANVLPTGRGL